MEQSFRIHPNSKRELARLIVEYLGEPGRISSFATSWRFGVHRGASLNGSRGMSYLCIVKPTEWVAREARNR